MVYNIVIGEGYIHVEMAISKTGLKNTKAVSNWQFPWTNDKPENIFATEELLAVMQGVAKQCTDTGCTCEFRNYIGSSGLPAPVLSSVWLGNETPHIAQKDS